MAIQSATQIARAVQLAQKGDFSPWDNIAAKYSLLLENLSTFSIKVAAMISFLRLINSSVSDGIKWPTDLTRWAFFGSGPAISVRAIARIKGILLALGIDISKLIKFFDLDFSNNMLYEGKRAIEQVSTQLILIDIFIYYDIFKSVDI